MGEPLLLTDELLQPFVGGQAEMRHLHERWYYRGEIKAIAIIGGNTLEITFTWLAQRHGSPKWIKTDRSVYTVRLGFDVTTDIGPSEPPIGGGNRIRLNRFLAEEIITFFPPDGDKLDPVKVEGLQMGTGEVVTTPPDSYLHARRPPFVEALQAERGSLEERTRALLNKGYYTPRPRPWKIGVRDRGHGHQDIAVLDRFGDLVAENVSLVDAQFILEAVNSYTGPEKP